MSPRSCGLLLICVSAALCVTGLIGCNYGPHTTGQVMPGADDGIGPYYSRYTGPVRTGKSYQTVEQITFTEQGGDYDPVVSADGTLLIYSSTAQSVVPDIFLVHIGAGKSMSTRTQLTNTPWAEIQPCFSRDGKSFAYASARRGCWDICIESVANPGHPRCITEGMKSDQISPSWHPDGEWIAFSTFNQRSMRWELAMKNHRTGQLRLLGEGLFPKFSPDGRHIAFQRARDRAPRWFSIFILDLDEDLNSIGSPVEVVFSDKWAAINPAWSPDGKYLTFATVHESPEAQSTRRVLMGDDIWAVNVNGQDLTQLTTSPEPESHPFWANAPDGRNGRIFFCSRQNGPKNIWKLTPQLPEVYGSVHGTMPGPAPERAMPLETREKDADPGKASEPPAVRNPPPATPPPTEKTEPAKVPALPPAATSRPD
ncbi:MAG TPA: hypothetical protein PK280_06920 [Planctomycetota bacterium]|nr:hypothetical protein [Planctomycetota bacterium]